MGGATSCPSRVRSCDARPAYRKPPERLTIHRLRVVALARLEVSGFTFDEIGIHGAIRFYPLDAVNLRLGGSSNA